jgi:hypothetical protein
MKFVNYDFMLEENEDFTLFTEEELEELKKKIFFSSYRATIS